MQRRPATAAGGRRQRVRYVLHRKSPVRGGYITEEHTEVAIIGAGISGIGMACRLRREQPGRAFLVLEAREAIGGTWDIFRYPGVRSDSDMATYGYGFRPWADSREVAPGDDILAYLHETAEEHELGPRLRLGHRVQRLAWSSEAGRWTVHAQRSDGEDVRIHARFLVTCTGYYDAERGYRPTLPGEEDFTGDMVHPQSWPEALELEGRRIVVIGSGATAVTLVPALAELAAHVTMLQRSPTFVHTRPTVDPLSRVLRAVLPTALAHPLVSARNAVRNVALYRFTQHFPDTARRFLLRRARRHAGPDVDVETHFNPSYDPWDQRICLAPDGDLFRVLREGRASVVTDHIERITPDGIRLASGGHLDADLIVTATGLRLQWLGGAQLEVDGRSLAPTDLITYRGVMFANVPNLAAIIGYTSASWTLKVDLVTRWLCRLWDHMDAHGHTRVTPRCDDPSALQTDLVLSKLRSAGYVQRGKDALPLQGTERPWRNEDDWWVDVKTLGRPRFDDGVLAFDRRD